MQEMRVYLLNNTKPYHDENDGYSGDWFNCPVDFEEVKEKLGVEHEEQIEIADYELPFDLHSDTPLWEINANCRMVLELEGTPIGNEMKAIQQKWFSSFDNLSTIRTRYVTMMWVTVQLWQNTLSVRKMFSVRFLTNCKSISTITLMGMSWKWTTDTYLLQAACSVISKGVMWYRRNASLYRQSWKI